MTQQQPAAGRPETFDVFISYSRADTAAVLAVRQLLSAHGLASFLDKERLLAGLPWPEALERGLNDTRAVAVFIGPTGLGLWQKREMAFALDRQVAAEREGRPFPVIPVLLPGADTTPGFLFLNTWVDLRQDLAEPEAIEALVRVLRGDAAGSDQSLAGSLSPYQGLRPFGEDSAAFFCGREAFSAKIFEAVQRRPITAVIGPSGSGKSSIVQAGLVPLLRRQRPPARTWDVATFIPGARPFQQLAAALLPLLAPELGEADLAGETQKLARLLAQGEVPLAAVVERLLRKSEGTDRLLLVADQCEELFTLCPEAEAQGFLRGLLAAVDAAPLTVVLTLRGVFYDRLIGADRDLSDRLEQSTINLGPMTREELQRAIVEPARKTGLNFESGLAKRLLDDVGSEPGNLPLLEFALTELWLRRDQRLLTHRAYDEVGGVTGAIAGRAEAVYQAFSPDQQDIAKRLFLQLVWVGAGAETSCQEARQRLELTGLEAADLKVVDILCDARLLVLDHLGEQGARTVEVAHEALIRKWARLREWLDEDREFLLWRRRLDSARQGWLADGEDEAALLRGNALREAESWLARRAADLQPEENRFISAASELHRRLRLNQQRRQRRLFAATLAALAVLSVLTAVAVMKTLAAVSQELTAHAREQLDVDPERSVLLGIEAMKLKFDDESADVLRLALQESHLVHRLSVSDYHRQPAFDAEGQTLIALAGNTGQLGSWSWNGAELQASGLAARLPAHIAAISFSPDGSRIAVAEPGGPTAVIDLQSGRQVSELAGAEGAPVSLAFSANDGGKRILAAGTDGRVRIWDAGTGSPILDFAERQGNLRGALFSPDGGQALSFSEAPMAVWWNARDGRVIHRLEGQHTANVQCAAISPDGRFIALGSSDTSVSIWLAESGKPLAKLAGHRDSVVAVAFSPTDPNLLATASRDGKARLWTRPDDSDEWQSVAEFKGHTKPLTGLAFDPGGRWIATTARDWTIRIWDTDTEEIKHALMGHRAAVNDVAFSPDGRALISASSDNTARLWSLAGNTSVHVLQGHGDSVTRAAFDHGGSYAITASIDGTARIWDVRRGLPLQRLAGHRDAIGTALFDPSGKRVVTASEDASARIWDPATGAVLRVLDGHETGAAEGADPAAAAMAVSPDQRFAASVEQGTGVRIRDLASGQVTAELQMEEGGVVGIAVGPGGEILALGNRAGDITFWQRTGAGWRPRSRLKGQGGPLTAVSFDLEGKRLATATDRSVRIWNVAAGIPVGKTWTLESPAVNLRFAGDGFSLLSTGADRQVALWRIDDGRLMGRFCPGCASLPGHDQRVWSARFSPDGRLVVTASRDGTARLWESPTGRVVDILHGHTASVVDAVFSPDGRRILTISRDHTARLWHRIGDSDAYEISRVLEGHEDELTDAAFSPDGRQVATASRDFTARLWDADSGRPVFTLRHHGDWVNGVEFSPDGKTLVTASRDGTAALWDLADGTVGLQLRGHRGAVNRARFDPAGETVVTASDDGSLRVWNLTEIRQGKSCRICSGTDEDICRWAHRKVPRDLSHEEREQFHVPDFTRLLSFRCPT